MGKERLIKKENNMTIQELQVKLQESQAEIELLIAETPTTFEEFNELRLRQDVAQSRFQMLQTLHNNMMMVKSLQETTNE